MSRPTSRLATALLCCTRAAAIDSAHSFYRSKFGWYAADNHSHALSRPLLAAPDKALYTPELDALFNDLDAIVEQHYVERHGGGRGEKVRLGAAAAATTLRAGSTARYRHQTDFYYRLGTGPWVQHVCEIGACWSRGLQHVCEIGVWLAEGVQHVCHIYTTCVPTEGVQQIL
mmetsp:Transcript_1850/g.2852  ORF Transcript_1850/g.2852 Transcript_1850/m.2852 type:complete len:172 (+) Transcript_1850:136-651(+)|eukprot:CAMPEP_0184391444 /NCGR_PEP_ID=MMETSP0007-20130409/14107_1 /TAXON_ID=97485 /ORGANISM="Prymnesium parvum, Strain Texoma1" /LENGTH=171 /DNA_ID=CAMNT_0026741565 /DNA_START=136 /DNA_END=651 /DNA_ORIENTATION=-